MRVPVVALRAAHRRMEREYSGNPEKFSFKYPYFNEVNTYTEIMQRQMREIEIVRLGPEAIQLMKQPTHLWTDVILPASRFISPILAECGMTTLQVSSHGFQSLPKVRVDQAHLTQVIFNLIDNAIKYFPKDRPAREFSCDLRAYSSDTHIRIDVEDNGAGLSDDDTHDDRLFSFGYRSKSARTIEVRGSGIGLWMSRGIIERHGGTLRLTKHRHPTTFTITLPIQDAGGVH